MRGLAVTLITFLFLFVANANALVTTVTFPPGSPPADILCGQTWTESGVSMSLAATTAPDCGLGPCTWGRAHNLPGNVSLNPARLIIEAATLSGAIVSVQADVQDPIGVNDMRLHLYNGSTLLASTGNLTIGSLETLELEAGGASVTHIVLSSCGGHCFEVRIVHDAPVPAKPSTWGAVKALFD